ncbi:MAG: hypothetical protein B6D64_10385 [Bacteroidetes bacterium 4484_276]|nr:MAG: hypothetical protein B6D64_10385 [Bacteroidetes bacterium 4484_276]
MISASKIKYVKSLGLQKFRELHSHFVVEGPKMVAELLKSDFVIGEIFAVEPWLDDNRDKLKRFSGNIIKVTEKEISRLSGLKTANKVLATVEIPKHKISDKIFDKLTLALDGISDPGNLGTIIRVADWFGIQSIICSTNTVELYNPKVIQATMGSLFRVKLYYDNLDRIIVNSGKKIPILGTTLDGENIYKADLPRRAMIVIGSEPHGISPSVIKLLDRKITIPSSGTETESLNAAVATAITCSEFMRDKLIGA